MKLRGTLAAGRRISLISLKQPDLNQVLANRLKAIVKKAESVLTAGRIAC